MTRLLWRLIERRLLATLSASHAAATIGDLAEDYARRLDRLGSVRSVVWLVREAWSLDAAYRRRARSRRSPIMLESEVRSALRRLSARPSVSLVSAILLGIGIALCTAAFSIVDAVLLRPSPFRDAERLVQQSVGHSEPELVRAWRESGFFEQVEASRSSSVQIGQGVQGRAWAASEITPGTFAMLGARPALGRGFAPAATDEVMLSDALWQSAYGGDAGVLGRRLDTARGPATIVGVMPPAFRYPATTTAAWMPLDLVSRERGLFTITGRLRRGVTADAALERHLKALAFGLAQLPRNYSGPPLQRLSESDVGGRLRAGVWLILAGASIVLVLFSATVACLVLTGLAARRRELGTCTALGASRARLVREALLENAFIGAIGVALGISASVGLVAIVPAVFHGHSLNAIDLDLRALLAASSLGIGTVMLAGLTPCLLGTRGDVLSSLRTQPLVCGDTWHASVFRHGLLVAQVALTCSLLTGAVLLIRSFANLVTVDRGLHGDGIQRMRVMGLDDAFTSGAAMRVAADRIAERFAVWPAVADVALSREVPPSAAGSVLVRDAGRHEAIEVERYRVDSRFLALYGIPIRRGRSFAPDDRPGKVIVSEHLAHRLWPGLDPVGRSLSMGGAAAEVVGVAAEVLLPSIDAGVELPEIYSPLGSESRTLDVNYRCRGTCPPPEQAQARIAALHPRLTTSLAPPAEEEYVRQLHLPGAMAAIGAVFTSVGTMGALGGLFTALMYSVGIRRREFGIRAALGASPRRLRWLVIRDGASLVGSGVVVGVVGGWLVARALTPFHYGVSDNDPTTWAAVLIIVATAGLAASALPARAAARTNPAGLLRQD